MGLFSKGSNSTTQTQTTSVDPAAYAAYQKLIGQAQTTAETPWNPGTAQNIAGFTGDQLAAFNNVRGGIAQPYIDQATGFATSGAGPVSQTMAQYYNPFKQSVIDASLRDIDYAAARENSGIAGKSRMSGSLGGDREAVALELARERQANDRNQVIANLNSQNYTQAIGAAQNDAARSLQGAGIMGNLGQLAYTDTNALLGIGGQQQQNEQAKLDAASANASAQSAYPFQTQQWLAGILGSATPNMGSTTTGTKTGPQPNTISQAIGAGIAAAPYLAKLSTGGAVDRAAGGGIGYVPQFTPQGGGMRAPQMSFGPDQPQKSLADHWKDVQSTAKSTSEGLNGISEGANDLGKWMNSSTTPGGWSTSVDHGSAMGNLSAGISNIFGRAFGGAVEQKDDNDPAGFYDIGSNAPSGGIAAPMPLMDIAKARMANPQMMPVDAAPSAPALMDIDARPQVAGAPAGAGDAYAPPPPTIGQGPLNPTGGVAGWSATVPNRTETTPIPATRQGIGERFTNWLQSKDAEQTLVPMGFAMMAASREGGKGSTGIHFGIGGMEGLKSQAAFRKGEREQEIEQAKMKLAERAQALREAEGNRAEAMHPYDLAYKQAQTKAMNAQATNKEDPSLVFRIREREAERMKLDKNSPEYRDFVLTGKIGKDEISATAQKQIIESEESMSNIPATRELITRALELNKKAYEGVLGKTYADLESKLPIPQEWRTEGAQATRDLSRLMLSQVLSKLKETFGAAPTEGERKILVDLETAASGSEKDRETILNLALKELDKREKFNQRMLEQLRGKTLFKPQPAAPSAATSTPDPLGIR